MRTVKEVSDITGISVRTLHYYAEIGLLKPSAKSEAGYRLYDDKALEDVYKRHADLKDNMDMSRIKEPKERDFLRLEKYKKAKALLEE